MIDHREALEIIVELIRRRVDGPREIRPSDHIQRDLGLDSLAVMELASDVERRFDVDIPTELLDRLSTVDDVSRAIVALKADAAPR